MPSLRRNAFRDAFADRVAFLDLFGGEQRTLTGDRTEFIGRNGSLARPAALGRVGLSDRTGAAMDPCGAVQVRLTLEPSQELTVVGLLGEAADDASVSSLVRRSRAPQGITAALDDVQSFWRSLLGSVQVTTPDRSMDLMLNGWLLYQTLACRIWGRVRLLSVERRVRLPRSAAGRARADDGGAASGAQSHRPRRLASVRRGRRAALVARAGRPGRAHAVLGRPALAASTRPCST